MVCIAILFLLILVISKTFSNPPLFIYHMPLLYLQEVENDVEVGLDA